MPDPKEPVEDQDDDAPFDEDEALDEALEETFPASDPIAPSLPGGDD